MHLGKVLTLILAVFCQTAAAQTLNVLNIHDNEGGAVCGSRTPQIEVFVTGVHAKGILTVELYKPSDRYFLRKESRLKRIRVPAQDGSQTVCFNIDAPGSFALAAYHDVDGDRKLARQWNRLPAEPFALSNGQKLKLRMPKFEDAAFLAGDQTTVVRLDLRQ